MKIRLFFILLAISVYSSNVHAEGLILSDPAVKGYYESTYKRAKGHKAFAAGPYRAFGMVVSFDSAKGAEKFALKECKQNATRIRDLKPADRVCRIIDIDNQVFGQPP